MKNIIYLFTFIFILSACVSEQDKFAPEREASFPGGKQMLNKYLSSNLVYPETAVENEIEGKVYVKFVVREDGSVTDATIVKHAHQLLDQEALRVVRKMPKWLPAFLKGKRISSYFNLPVTFRLQ